MKENKKHNRKKRTLLLSENPAIWGVCGGLANKICMYGENDASLIRVVFILLLCTDSFRPFAFQLYFCLWFFMMWNQDINNEIEKEEIISGKK